MLDNKYLLLLAFDALLLELDEDYEGVPDEQNDLIQSKVFESYGLSVYSSGEEVQKIRELLIKDARDYRNKLIEEI